MSPRLEVSRSVARAWSRLLRRARASDFEDREFLRAGSSPSLTLWMTGPRPRRILVTTKATWIGWAEAAIPAGLLVVQRYGLPSQAHVEWVRETGMRMGAKIVFVGDLDPLDLTIFAAWRSGNPAFREGRERPLPIRYGGIADGWARRAGGFQEWSSRIRIAMQPFERDHWALLKRLLPDAEAHVGADCFRLLEGGHKVEIEGATNPAIHGRGFPGTVLRALGRR